ncbi:MAG: MotA/TolQ/ExbB proton channel family protein [Proteobacteria bacterium]|nr:MotA/TolQ/ExbB proton channel family protein [Pseudomonadota bacterium]
MVVENSLFDSVAISIVKTLTYIINTYSGVLQLSIYFLILITFCFALIKLYQSFRSLVRCDFDKIAKMTGSSEFYSNIKTPISFIAASFFEKTKKHYLAEKENEKSSHKIIPPDAFIRDAAFQFSERYFEENFVDPLSMAANLMPPLGFIGTILGMVIHFLSNTGTLNTDLTIAGIATALYTTLIALICYTFLEFLKKCIYSLAYKRIDEGLAAVSNNIKINSKENDRGKSER